MKQTIKIFAALVMVLGLTVGAKAQNSQSDADQIPAKAQVIKALTVTPGQQLSFGMVTQGESKTIGSSGNVLAGTLGTGSTGVGAEQAGTFTIEKGQNTALTLDFTLPTNLSDGTNNLPITFVDFSGTQLAKLTGGTAEYPFTPGTGSNALSITSSVSNYYLIGTFGVSIGGTVTPADDQAEGVYSGDITLTATYN